jgi:hypothetical protein
MANAMFSPKDFKAFVIEEATTGTSPAITSGLFQLDVDSVAFPSLNPNMVMDVRTSTGRVLAAQDFFQDNEHREVSVTLSGIYHKDGGHNMLLQSVCGNALTPGALQDVSLAYNATGVSGAYGVAEGDKTFTLVLAAPDTTDGVNIVIPGCKCSEFSITADMGTNGGMYMFSATISSGKNPNLANEDTPSTTSGGAIYAGSDKLFMSGLSAQAVGGVSSNIVLNNFGVTISSPCVYTGTSSTGYTAYGRASEINVTANAQVKYDAATKGLLNSFNTQVAGSHLTANALTMTQTSATDCSISLPAAILTNVALSEGDVMMMDVEMKGVGVGSGNVITFDLAS